MASEEVHCSGHPLQILNSHPPLVSGALLGLDVVLNVNEQADRRSSESYVFTYALCLTGNICFHAGT